MAKSGSRRIFRKIGGIIGVALLFSPGVNAGVGSGLGNARSHFRRPPVSTPLFIGMGNPLPGVANNPADFANFSNGQLNFKEVETLNSASAQIAPSGGLGPLFNGVACAACHSQPALGGGGLFLREIRVRNRGDGAPAVQTFAVNNLLRSGPQTQEAQTIFRFGEQAEATGSPISSLTNTPSLCQRQLLTDSTYSPALPVCDTTSARLRQRGQLHR